MIYFLRSAPYDYKIQKKSLYESFNEVAKRVVSPKLTNGARKTFFATVPDDVLLCREIFSSPNTRSVETARLISKHPKILSSLVEIGYSMEDFISENEFLVDNKPDVTRARQGFVNAFIQNKTKEKYLHVIKRIENVLSTCCLSGENKIAVISHGFYLKVIEAYIRDKSIKHYPNRLLNYFDGKKETFKFCEGFIIEIKKEKLIFVSYIRQNVSSHV